MSNLDHYKTVFNSVGWFIPPYITLGFLSSLATTISAKVSVFSQADLESWLALVYSSNNLAAMVCERYPETPHVQDFKLIVAESVEAHFLGLNHVAVSGLMPVIEGAGKKIAQSRGLTWSGITNVFVVLADDCKNQVIQHNVGATGEIISMLDSFIEFAKNHLYINSNLYVLPDKTNRHGILHGAYSDTDYGEPINFYKAIAAIDFLCFVAALRAPISWFAPSPSEASLKLKNYYDSCIEFATRRI